MGIHRRRFAGCEKLLCLLLASIGVITILVIVLPYNVWMILLGILLIFTGYKLFI
ncbi:MAG: hypothetical protein PWQ37_1066 [Candidatus Petromonas sp.]|jgi:hypothetical protein|nr:hypothetical protein [Candidatus Petromonas sp.]